MEKTTLSEKQMKFYYDELTKLLSSLLMLYWDIENK